MATPIRWCAWCNWEGEGAGPRPCPRCGKDTVSLGYRTGIHRGVWAYYSTLENVPKKDR